MLKWTAQRTALTIREEWDNSKLISSDVEVMTRELAQATKAHAFAVTTAGVDEVTASCEATLTHLGRVVEAVGFLQNRNLTGAYWERVERIMPLKEVSAWCRQYGDGQGAMRLAIRHERIISGARADSRRLQASCGCKLSLTLPPILKSWFSMYCHRPRVSSSTARS